MASAPLTAGPSITREVGEGRCPRPSGRQPRRGTGAVLRTTRAAWRAPQAAAAGKWRRPSPAGEPQERQVCSPTVPETGHRRRSGPPPGQQRRSALRRRRMSSKGGFRAPPPPSLKSSRGRSRGVDGLRGLGGARERGAPGASMGSALSAGSGHGPGRRPFPGGWTWIALAARGGSETLGRQAQSPARPRGCSTPARNGAAEPRASALYIAGGAELRCSCAPPCSRAPPPPPRVLARSRA